MPLSPVLAPWMETLRMMTVSAAAALIRTPVLPALRMPASVPVPLMVMDFVIVTAPKPPGSRTLISPPAAVLEIAPANVLQGAVRLHGLASSPTPETQVRVACACATEAMQSVRMAIKTKIRVLRFTKSSLEIITKWHRNGSPTCDRFGGAVDPVVERREV